MAKNNESKKKKEQVSKEKAESVKTVKICPRCSSPNVFTDYTSSASVVLGEINRLRCRNCNYSGVLFKEIDVNDLKDHKVVEQSELKGKTEMINTSYGFGIKPYFYIIGLVTIAAGILILRMQWWIFGVAMIVVGLAQILYALLARKKNE